MEPGGSHPCYTRAREAGFVAESSGHAGSEGAAMEIERNRVTAEANRQILESGIVIRDVYEKCGSDETTNGVTDYES